MVNYVLTFGIPAVLVLLALLVAGFTFTRLYHRSTRETSLVRTGAGGRKVVVDGGILVLPGLHEITKINMRTTRLEVQRKGTSALITLDRQRVDVGVEFYVTVQSNEDGIGRAAQTLGNRTGDVNVLRDMIEGKLVDGLRSVAAQMDLDDLHEKRSDFVQQVQLAVSEELTKNGLELETAALTMLDQTPMEGMDENNVFNAAGLEKQAGRIADSKKKRAEIEAETEVSVAKSKQQAAMQTYQLEQEQEEARVEQAVKLQALRTQEEIDRANRKEEEQQAAEEARINREIAIQQKSRDESRAKSEADEARAEAVKAEESVITEREVAEAERNRKIVLIQAEEEAQKNATSIRVSAQVEKEAAADRAAAMRELAEATAAEITIRAEAEKTAKLADAEGTRELIAAENTLSAEIIDFRLATQRIDAMPGIISEMVKPAEKIGNISIHKLDGMGGYGGGVSTGTGGSSNGGGGVVNQAFDEMRNMALQMPMLKSIGQQVGINMDQPMADMVSDLMDVEKPAPAVVTEATVEEGSAATSEPLKTDKAPEAPKSTSKANGKAKSAATKADTPKSTATKKDPWADKK
ncbi:flotillin domain-containing protein [Sulfitobacter sp. R18_1]|uniref:flotillin family protein n=1 Tax=Sulfitobacter sp. R18_1 TaxID=2821104 RepID=UPI001AD99667|nr:flotillin domain-containing protein [Sulfitobacter sp. R18_1]MBO9428253.1 flotillin [Sulfitobacter sp. R18_1]